jgi:hypothetical protein
VHTPPSRRHRRRTHCTSHVVCSVCVGRCAAQDCTCAAPLTRLQVLGNKNDLPSAHSVDDLIEKMYSPTTTSAQDLATSAQDMVTSAQDLATSAPGLAVGTTSSSSASESSSAISSQALSRRTGRCHLAERFVATCHAPLQLPCMQRAMRRAMQRAMHRAACRATRNKRRVCAPICACAQMHMHAIGHWLGLYGVFMGLWGSGWGEVGGGFLP